MNKLHRLTTSDAHPGFEQFMNDTANVLFLNNVKIAKSIGINCFLYCTTYDYRH